MISAALTSFLTGITEPIEFAFLFVAPVLYAIHALLAGAAYFTCIALGIKHGFTFSHGLDRLRRALPEIAQRALALRPRADLGGCCITPSSRSRFARSISLTPGREVEDESDESQHAARAGDSSRCSSCAPSAVAATSPASMPASRGCA